MPEEINRIVADQIAELLFIHSPEARGNLLAEGRPEAAIHDVGNTMIDTLVAMQQRIDAIPTPDGLEEGALSRRHAPSSGARGRHATRRPAGAARRRRRADSGRIPRTPANTSGASGWAPFDSLRLRLLEPLGYLDFISLVSRSAGVLTDSGGIQEETTHLGSPCFTLRANTERPVTVELGTNVLLGLAPDRIAEVPTLLDKARSRRASVPPLWDGHAAERIVDAIEGYFAASESSSAAVSAAITRRS